MHQRICVDNYRYDHQDDYIIHMAFKKWSGGYYSTDPEYDWPWSFLYGECSLLNGIMAGRLGGSSANFSFHGCQVAALAQFLIDDPRFGIEGYRSMYQQLEESYAHPMDALIANVSGNINTWLPEFWIALLEGDIYAVDYNRFLHDPADGWSPAPGGDPFLLNDGLGLGFNDLSAKVVTIHLAEEYLPGTGIHCEVTSDTASEEDLSVILFAKGAGELRYLGHGQSWTLPDIQEDLIETGVTELIALVANSSYSPGYLQGSTIEVEMRLEEELHFNQVEVELTLDCWFDYTGSENPEFEPAYEINWLHGEGEISGTGFYVPIDYDIGDDYHVTGHIEGTVSEDFTRLLSLTAEQTSGDTYVGLITQSFTLGQPMDCQPGAPGHFLVEGAATCGKIGGLARAIDYGTALYWLSDWQCTGSSELYISFWNF